MVGWHWWKHRNRTQASVRPWNRVFSATQSKKANRMPVVKSLHHRETHTWASSGWNQSQRFGHPISHVFPCINSHYSEGIRCTNSNEHPQWPTSDYSLHPTSTRNICSLEWHNVTKTTANPNAGISITRSGCEGTWRCLNGVLQMQSYDLIDNHITCGGWFAVCSGQLNLRGT